MKRNYAKITIGRLPVTYFPAHRSTWKQKNLPLSSLDLNLVIFLVWRVLLQKLYRQDLIIITDNSPFIHRSHGMATLHVLQCTLQQKLYR